MAEQIPEGIEILDSDGNVTIRLEGEKARIVLGTEGKEGGIFVLSEAGEQTFSAGAGGGDIAVLQKIDGVSRNVLRFDASGADLYVGNQGKEGDIVVRDGDARHVFHFDSRAAALYLGAAGNEGDIYIRNNAGDTTFQVDGNEGIIYLRNSAGDNTFQVAGNEGDITVWRTIGGVQREVLKFDASAAALYIGSQDNEGDIVIRNGAGDNTFQVDGAQGDIYVQRRIGGVQRDVLKFDASSAALYIGSQDNEGDIFIRNSAGDNTFKVDGGQGDIFVWRKIGGVQREVLKFDASAAALYIGSQDNEGDIIVRDGDARNVFHFDSSHAALYLGAAGNEGDVIVRDGAGTERIRLDGASGDVQLRGADCAEDFDILSGFEAEPGMIMVIDSEDTLRPCDSAYDKRVAGVISGAGGMTPGITLDKQERSSTRRPLSLAGKAFCKADAAYGPIQIGDLLTTSPTSGHAMKADEPLKAFGAVIGKALRPLIEGKGLIPILVSLQ